MKVVKNVCYGGFGLSVKAESRYLELKGMTAFFYKQNKYSSMDGYDEYVRVTTEDAQKESGLSLHTVTADLGEVLRDCKSLNENYFSSYRIKRDDPMLIQVVEELGEEANGACADLEIAEIPDGIEYEISEYDGLESIHEAHRSW